MAFYLSLLGDKKVVSCSTTKNELNGTLILLYFVRLCSENVIREVNVFFPLCYHAT